MVHLQPEHSAVEIRSEVLHRFDYCQELLPGGAVILLGGRESFAVVSNDYLPTFLDLRQYGTRIVVTGISVQDVFLCGIGVGQNGRSEQATLKAVEYLLFDRGPLPIDPFVMS